MLQSGLEVGDVITHRIAAADFEQAFAVVETGECGKVVLDWS
jgi:threonine 3-dehydrogenase